jgi:hypothetical protein
MIYWVPHEFPGFFKRFTGSPRLRVPSIIPSHHLPPVCAPACRLLHLARAPTCRLLHTGWAAGLGRRAPPGLLRLPPPAALPAPIKNPSGCLAAMRWCAPGCCRVEREGLLCRRLLAGAAAAASCSRCLRACRLASTSRSTSAWSTSGGGTFSATSLTPRPKAKRLRCLGGRSGSAISGCFRMVYWPPIEFSGSKQTLRLGLYIFNEGVNSFGALRYVGRMPRAPKTFHAASLPPLTHAPSINIQCRFLDHWTTPVF